MNRAGLLASIVVLASLVLVMRLASSGARVEAVTGGDDSASSSQQASPVSVGELDEPVAVVRESRVPESRSSSDAVVRKFFQASGGIVIHAESARVIRLQWTADSGNVEMSATAGEARWSGTLPEDSYLLTKAWLDDSLCELAGEYRVSPEFPACDLALIQADHCLLELVDAIDRTRIRRAQIQPAELLANLADGPQSVKRVKTSSGSRTEIREVNADPEAPCTIAYTGADVLLPPWAQRCELHIGSEGYRDHVAAPLGRAGRHVIALEPLRRVHVAISTAADERMRFDVEIRSVGGEVLERFEDRKAPVEVSAACSDSIDRVEVVVFAKTSTSIEMNGIERLVPLNAAGDTYVAIDPTELQPVGLTAMLDVTIAAAAEVESIRSWRMSLISVRTDGGRTIERELLTSSLSQWDCLSPNRTYARQFSDLQAGVYDLVIRPIGHTRRVELISGQHLTERIEVPALAQLQLWPVDTEGTRITDLASLDVHVIWRWAAEGVDSGQGTNSEVASTRAPDDDGSVGAGLASGTIHFVPRTAHGSWLLTAPSGRAVRIEVLGPEVLVAKPLTIELVPGSMDATITFAGL